jgi:DNA-binding LytR/AlgR family response regulator
MHNFFFIRIDGRYIRISFSDIIYVEAARNYIKIVTDKKVWLALISLKRIEQILPSSLFKRIHKSYIVALEKIDEFNNERVYIKNQPLPIGLQYKGILEKSVLIANGDTHEMDIPSNYFGCQSLLA